MNTLNTFLDKLFSYQYFGIILFSVIGVLAVLFIILFAVAISDAKKNKITNNIEEENKKEKKEEPKEEKATKKEDKKTKEDKKEKVEKKKEEKEIKEENKEEEPIEIEIPLDDIIESTKVEEEPVIDLGVNLESTLTDLDNTLASLNITKEEKNVNIDQEKEDLQSLAMSLVKDYKREKKLDKEEIIEEVKLKEEIVKPKEEKKIETIAMPNLDDIPMSKAIKVIDQTPANYNPKHRATKRRTAIDSIVGEEYKLK